MRLRLLDTKPNLNDLRWWYGGNSENMSKGSSCGLPKDDGLERDRQQDKKRLA